MNRFSVSVCALAFVLLHQVSIAQKATVTANKMNVFYIGIDNPVTIMAEGLKCEDVVAEIDAPDGIIEHEGYHGKCGYNVRVKKPGKTTIYVYEKKEGKNRKLIDSCVFRIKRLPDPVITMGGTLRSGIVNHNVLKAQSGILALLENFDIDARFRVEGFVLQYCNEGSIAIIENKGTVFNEKIKRAIAEAKPADILHFDNIKIVGPDGSQRKMSPISFLIDGYIERRCKEGGFGIKLTPTFYESDSTEGNACESRGTFNCSCDCIDDALGKFDKNNKKTGWWIYNKIFNEQTVLSRKEFYNEDTATQYFYTNNYVSKMRTYINAKLNGKYAEYHADKVLSIEGQYAIDTVGFDTTFVIDPNTLDEVELTEAKVDEVKAGTWNYYTPAGKLYRREHYQKGKLLKEENF